MTPVENRPTRQSIAATLALPPVVQWLRSRGKALDDATQCLFGLTKLFEYTEDPYVLARYAETEWKWPADFDLVCIFSHAFTQADELHETAIHDWVTRNGIRFPRKPREPVLFRDADGELCHGVVQNVFPATAEALVAVITDLEERNHQTTMIRLRAEEVLERAAV